MSTSIENYYTIEDWQKEYKESIAKCEELYNQKDKLEREIEIHKNQQQYAYGNMIRINNKEQEECIKMKKVDVNIKFGEPEIKIPVYINDERKSNLCVELNEDNTYRLLKQEAYDMDKKNLIELSKARSSVMQCLYERFLNAPIYVNSYITESCGVLKNTCSNDITTLYIVKENNGRIALGTKVNDICSAIGWIDNKYIKEENQEEHEQMENKANSMVESLRNKLADALKKQYEETKEYNVWELNESDIIGVIEETKCDVVLMPEKYYFISKNEKWFEKFTPSHELLLKCDESLTNVCYFYKNGLLVGTITIEGQ